MHRRSVRLHSLNLRQCTRQPVVVEPQRVTQGRRVGAILTLGRADSPSDRCKFDASAEDGLDGTPPRTTTPPARNAVGMPAWQQHSRKQSVAPKAAPIPTSSASPAMRALSGSAIAPLPPALACHGRSAALGKATGEERPSAAGWLADWLAGWLDWVAGWLGGAVAG